VLVTTVGAHFIASTNGGHKHSPPSGKDVATFCYTSGTTGNPKGALITHENLTSAMAGVIGSMPEIEVQPYDRHISYLPLPHIFERKVMAQVFLAGASVAFYRGDPTLLVQDFQACRPTLLAVAPRVLNSIYDKVHAFVLFHFCFYIVFRYYIILFSVSLFDSHFFELSPYVQIHNGINAAGGVKKKIFDAAVASKTAGLKNGGHFTHALYDRLIFNKIKAALGMDQLRFMVSGSAPLSGNVMVFFRCLLGIPIIEGYGQTEGAAAATVGHPDHMETVGHVGGPTASTEVVLVDVPEMGYLHRDTEHRGQECRGRGEICIRGPSVFPGYYRDEEKTREAIDDEGWLHSGDIGLWRLDGTLQIIDRKKNIFKLSQGEYVAPEKIENILLNSPLIAQCFVYGDSLQSCLVAIVVPDEEPLRAYLSSTADEKSLLLSKAPIEEICASQISNAAISKDIARVSQENGLHGFECVKAIHLEKTPFSVEADLMTPTFKLKRQQAQQRYEKEIAKLYAGLPPPASKL
jgi:long-chain acyl-CoA synthetase